jgi:hypothetical protein
VVHTQYRRDSSPSGIKEYLGLVIPLDRRHEKRVRALSPSAPQSLIAPSYPQSLYGCSLGAVPRLRILVDRRTGAEPVDLSVLP